MKNRDIETLRVLAKERNPLTSSKFRELQERMWRQVEWPKFSVRKKGPLKHNDLLEIRADRPVLPRIDYYDGELVDGRSRKQTQPMTALFPSARGTVHAAVRADPKRGTLSVTVPKDAVSGVVMLLLPLEEYYGPAPELSAIDDKHRVLRHYVGFWKDGGKECCTSLEAEQASGICNYLEEFEYELRTFRYVPFPIGVFSVRCETCHVECPHGAIKFDEHGDCYVDVDICRGQTYRVDRSQTEMVGDNEVFARVDEEACWECFDGNEIVSNQCPQGRLRRVAYNNGVCCASCNTKSRLYGLDFMELCSQGAISRVARESGGMIFQVDPSLCTGCMACYNGINCFNNIASNTTVRMVSYIDPPASQFEPIEPIECPPHVAAYCGKPVTMPCLLPVSQFCMQSILDPCRPSIGGVCPTILPHDATDLRTLLQERWQVEELDHYVRTVSRATLDRQISSLPKDWQKPVRYLLNAIKKDRFNMP